MMPANVSLGYSVAVGEFTGDSEQGEEEPIIMADYVLLTHCTSRNDAAVHVLMLRRLTGVKVFAVWRVQLSDGVWSELRRGNESCLCVSGSRP